MSASIEFLNKAIEDLQKEIDELDKSPCDNCGFLSDRQIEAVRKGQEINILIGQLTAILGDQDESELRR